MQTGENVVQSCALLGRLAFDEGWCQSWIRQDDTWQTMTMLPVNVVVKALSIGRKNGWIV